MMYFRHLIIRQGFCGEEVDSSGLGLLEDLLEHGDVVAQGLAAGCRCDKDHIFALMHQFDGTGLVTVEPRDAPFGKDLLYQGIHPGRIRGELTL
jgi:hypothetical protein